MPSESRAVAEPTAAREQPAHATPERRSSAGDAAATTDAPSTGKSQTTTTTEQTDDAAAVASPASLLLETERSEHATPERSTSAGDAATTGAPSTEKSQTTTTTEQTDDAAAVASPASLLLETEQPEHATPERRTSAGDTAATGAPSSGKSQTAAATEQTEGTDGAAAVAGPSSISVEKDPLGPAQATPEESASAGGTASTSAPSSEKSQAAAAERTEGADEAAAAAAPPAGLSPEKDQPEHATPERRASAGSSSSTTGAPSSGKSQTAAREQTEGADEAATAAAAPPAGLAPEEDQPEHATPERRASAGGSSSTAGAPSSGKSQTAATQQTEGADEAAAAVATPASLLLEKEQPERATPGRRTSAGDTAASEKSKPAAAERPEGTDGAGGSGLLLGKDRPERGASGEEGQTAGQLNGTVGTSSTADPSSIALGLDQKEAGEQVKPADDASSLAPERDQPTAREQVGGAGDPPPAEPEQVKTADDASNTSPSGLAPERDQPTAREQVSGSADAAAAAAAAAAAGPSSSSSTMELECGRVYESEASSVAASDRPSCSEEPQDAPFAPANKIGQLLAALNELSDSPDRLQEVVLLAQSVQRLPDPPTREEVTRLIAAVKTPEPRCAAVRSLLIHTIAGQTARMPDADVPLAAVGELILRTMVGDTLQATVHVASVHLVRFPQLAETCSTAVMAELLRAFSHPSQGAPDCSDTELLLLLMLANSVFSALSTLPAAVSQNVTASLAAAAPRFEGRQAVSRELQHLIARLSNGKPSPDASADRQRSEADEEDRTYTEHEVKAFLYQRKLEWESQLRKRDRMITSQQAQLEDLRGQLSRLKSVHALSSESLVAKDAKVEDLEEQVGKLHQTNLDLESKLEDYAIFFREREHQLSQLEERIERRDTENALLGNENRLLLENNKELQAYVNELIDQADPGKGRPPAE
ncbi:hypothetical protein DIPPA_31651 [Diplonema papillatum]|nr:hypothetical protein DIPPA_31651 [Diplonema papillatum]